LVSREGQVLRRHEYTHSEKLPAHWGVVLEQTVRESGLVVPWQSTDSVINTSDQSGRDDLNAIEVKEVFRSQADFVSSNEIFRLVAWEKSDPSAYRKFQLTRPFQFNRKRLVKGIIALPRWRYHNQRYLNVCCNRSPGVFKKGPYLKVNDLL